VLINDYDETKEAEIQNALYDEWGFDPYIWESYISDKKTCMDGEARGCLGKETKEKFADRISKAIWKANDGFCHIEVIATCLEPSPHGIYIRDKDSYNQLVTWCGVVL